MTEDDLLAVLAAPPETSSEATADYTMMMGMWQEWVKFSAAYCDFVGEADGD
jgi:hypothetical protein